MLTNNYLQKLNIVTKTPFLTNKTFHQECCSGIKKKLSGNQKNLISSIKIILKIIKKKVKRMYTNANLSSKIPYFFFYKMQLDSCPFQEVCIDYRTIRL